MQPELGCAETVVSLRFRYAFLDSARRSELRLGDLFDKVRTRTVEADEIRRFDHESPSFFNINTLADYQTALARWPEEN